MLDGDASTGSSNPAVAVELTAEGADMIRGMEWVGRGDQRVVILVVAAAASVVIAGWLLCMAASDRIFRFALVRWRCVVCHAGEWYDGFIRADDGGCVRI